MGLRLWKLETPRLPPRTQTRHASRVKLGLERNAQNRCRRNGELTAKNNYGLGCFDGHLIILYTMQTIHRLTVLYTSRIHSSSNRPQAFGLPAQPHQRNAQVESNILPARAHNLSPSQYSALSMQHVKYSFNNSSPVDRPRPQTKRLRNI